MLQTVLEVTALALLAAGVYLAAGLAAALLFAGGALLAVSWRLGSP